MAGGGMGGMPQGDGQQGSIVGMPVGPGMGNPMGGGPGMMGGLGMGGMGFGGGQPGMGFGQGPGYGVDNFQPGQGGFAGTPMSNPGMPQGDTFQPQNPSQGLSMAQIGQMLRGLQGGQMQQMPQAAPQYSASPSMQQMPSQQPVMTGSAERNWISQSPYAQQTPQIPQQQASQIGQGAYRELFGKPAVAQAAAQPQQTIREMRNQSRGIADIPIRGRQSARQTLSRMRSR